jgi:hypothetical protein
MPSRLIRRADHPAASDTGEQAARAIQRRIRGGSWTATENMGRCDAALTLTLSRRERGQARCDILQRN